MHSRLLAERLDVSLGDPNVCTQYVKIRSRDRCLISLFGGSVRMVANLSEFPLDGFRLTRGRCEAYFRSN